MSQFDLIKNIAKFGLENDQERLLSVLNELIEYSKKTKKVNFALQLQSILKEGLRQQKISPLTKVGSDSYYNRIESKELDDLILEKLTSEYSLDSLVSEETVKSELELFIKEHRSLDLLRKFDLPVANKILLHGPSGCGKTLTSYAIAGELQKLMLIVNLGAIVSSKLGETSKNLAKIFRKATTENCIIFIDEFDSLGKVRDYSQDHGEMKRVVNTILQLFDYLPQDCIVIAATNQKDMLDDALLRRFDVSLKLNLPNEKQIEDLIKLTLKKGDFQKPSSNAIKSIVKKATGLSYFSIQKTLITALKRSIFESQDKQFTTAPAIDMAVWEKLITLEKQALQVN